MEIIDGYTHITPDGYLEALSKTSNPNARDWAARFHELGKEHPQFYDLQARISDMDDFSISAQVTMVHNIIEPHMFQLEPKDHVRLAKLINDGVSRVVQRSGGRVIGLATIPFTALEDEGLEEMDRAVKDLNLKGFMALSHVLGKPIDKFQPFWERASRLDTPVYIHPGDPISNAGREYENEYDLMHVFGWPFETTLALCRLAFGGTIQKYPNLRILGHHFGGMIPFFAGRIQESYRRKASPPKPDRYGSIPENETAMDQLRKLYYDTAVGGNEAAVKCGYDVFGADRMVFSTDYPWGPNGGRGRLELYPKAILKLGTTESEQATIYNRNLKKIFRI